MDPHRQLAALTDLAETLGIAIRRVPRSVDAGEHPGGALVVLRGTPTVFLNPDAPVPDQIALLADCLRTRREIEEMFLPPEVRELLEDGSGE